MNLFLQTNLKADYTELLCVCLWLKDGISMCASLKPCKRWDTLQQIMSIYFLDRVLVSDLSPVLVCKPFFLKGNITVSEGWDYLSRIPLGTNQ